MRKAWQWKTLLFLFVILIFLTSCSPRPVINSDAAVNLQEKEPVLLPCLYYEENQFLKNQEKAETFPIKGKMLAAISPHHPPAMADTAAILQSAKANDAFYDTIYIVGPNHSGESKYLLTSNASWQTPFGVATADVEAIDALLQDRNCLARTDDTKLTEEWSVSTLIPYVHSAFPEARIVPVLLSKGTSTTQVQALAQQIACQMQQHSILLLCSIDFSHYLPYLETLAKDEETKALIEQDARADIKPLSSSYLDSPETLLTLLYLKDHFPNSVLALERTTIQRDLPPQEHLAYSYLLYTLTLPQE